MSSNQHLGNLAIRAAIYSDTLTKQAGPRTTAIKEVGRRGLEMFGSGVSKVKKAPGQAWGAAKKAPGWAGRKAWETTKAAPGAIGRSAWSLGESAIPNTTRKALYYPGGAAAMYYAPEAWRAATKPGQDMAKADTAMELINKMSELSAGQRFGYALDPETARYRMLAQLAEEYPQALDYYQNSGQLSTQEIQRILNQI